MASYGVEVHFAGGLPHRLHEGLIPRQANGRDPLAIRETTQVELRHRVVSLGH